jgi:hypothetical protein
MWALGWTVTTVAGIAVSDFRPIVVAMVEVLFGLSRMNRYDRSNAWQHPPA